jgi:hypothetical protein
MIAAAMLMTAAMMSFVAGDDALGRRIDLDGAVLFVPSGRTFGSGPVDVLLHLHGASATIEPAFVAAGWPGVLIEFNRNGLSSVYSTPFRDPTLLTSLIEKTMAALRREKMAAEPRPGRLVLSTFSAGFGGAREVLKNQADVARINTVILADSLYCGYEGEPRAHRVDAALMAPFRAFADQAARGENQKTMLLTHSSQVPEGYASTTETADDLIARVEARDEKETGTWPDDFRPTRRLARGRFVVLGFDGERPEDHLRHLRKIAVLWAEAKRLMDRPER